MKTKEKSIIKLELPKIKRELLKFAGHPLSKKWIEELDLAKNFSQCEDRLFNTGKGLELLRLYPDLPLGELPEMEAALKKIEASYILNSKDIFNIHILLLTIGKVIAYFSNKETNQVFQRIIKLLEEVKNLERQIDKIVDEYGSIKDSASLNLARIRKELKNKSSGIRRTIENILKKKTYQSYLQDEVVVKKGDSYCLSVKKEFAYKVPGVIEYTSASGSTVFIEPSEVRNIRSEIKLLEKKEKEEINLILKEISSYIFVEKDSIKNNFNYLAEYNFILAKARYTNSIKGNIPILREEKIIDLRHSRHPLLTGEVISNNLSLGESYRHIIISGPNTGGKTVLLKMVGLFALMISLGLGITAAEGSIMAYFKNVFVDLGDEQSIENSLSTFSGHMYNVREMIENSDEDTLLLFDELGNGTDPSEGASLGMSILEHIDRLGVRSITTTHYGALKIFAYNNKNFANASISFDLKTLEPTYKLNIGTPGASLGIEVARRCGISLDIVEEAKDKLNKEEMEVSGLIKELEGIRGKIEENRTEIAKEKKIAEELRGTLERKLEKLNSEGEKKIKENVEKSQDLLQNLRIEAEEIIKELKKQKSFNPEASNKIREKIEDLNKSAEDYGINKEEKDFKVVDTLDSGDKVKIYSLAKEGEIVTADNKKKAAVVNIEGIKITIPYSDMLLIKEIKQTEVISIGKVTRCKDVPLEIDLRGKYLDEALYELEKYLDQAILCRYPSIRIIHGIGTGVLKKGIWDYLKKLPYVTSFRYGDLSEGSIGATVLYFQEVK